MELAIKKLPEFKFFHELPLLNLAGKSQESHTNFIDINKSSVMETFQETAPIPESYPEDSYEAFLLKQLQARESR